MTFAPEVTQMWSRDEFEVSTEDGRNKKAKIVEGYQVTVPPDYTKVQVASLSDLPATGSNYTGLEDVYLKNRSFKRLSPIYWLVIMTYQGQFPAIDQRPKVRWRSVKSTEPIDQDYNGAPIATVNHEPIDGVTKEISDLALIVRRNFRTVNLPAIHPYLDAVSTDEFQGFAPGMARLTEYEVDEKYEANNVDRGYFEVNARVEFRVPYNTTPDKAWYARIRHEGLIERLDSGVLVKAADEQHEPVNRPVLLKANGKRELDPNNAHWLEIKRYGLLPYNALGLL